MAAETGDTPAVVEGAAPPAPSTIDLPVRTKQDATLTAGQALTGKQEHYLKRELISEQVKWEINELNSTTALQRFGAPFRSDQGEVPLRSPNCLFCDISLSIIFATFLS
ncbi:hypothetical protein NXS19_012508 [Fusarium pseudograminearum]|nr:hypothetical protein NXS19_012508 [Fusarium pseudograminearum]